MEFLEFEVPIKEILDQIDKCKSIEDESDVDITKTYNLLQKKLVETKKHIYGNLSAWQRLLKVCSNLGKTSFLYNSPICSWTAALSLAFGKSTSTIWR